MFCYNCAIIIWGVVMLRGENSVLVHSMSCIPDGTGLFAGIRKYGEYTGAELAKLPISIARQTIHFTLSHIVASHAGRVRDDKVAIIIPIKNIPQDTLSKFCGSPEDIFLLTDFLPLQGLDATLLIPEHLVGAYKSSELKKELGDGVHATKYGVDMNLQKCFVAYAQEKKIQYLNTNQYFVLGDTDSPIIVYNVHQLLEQQTPILQIKAKDAHSNLFSEQGFLWEHSLHILHHIEKWMQFYTSYLVQKEKYKDEPFKILVSNFFYEQDSPLRIIYNTQKNWGESLLQFLDHDAKQLYAGTEQSLALFVFKIKSIFRSDSIDEIGAKMLEFECAAGNVGSTAAPASGGSAVSHVECLLEYSSEKKSHLDESVQILPSKDSHVEQIEEGVSGETHETWEPIGGEEAIPNQKKDFIIKSQKLLYHAATVFKMIDVAVDGVNALEEPTKENIQKVVIDYVQLHGLVTGFNKLSVTTNMIAILGNIYTEKNTEIALEEAAVSVAFMIAPYILPSPIGIAYTAAATVYVGYNTISKVQSLYEKHCSKVLIETDTNTDTYAQFDEEWENNDEEYFPEFTSNQSEYGL
ncbi:MAG: hypothetical protein ACI8ZF_000347 [Candidatus Midichloriaceae bacterium]|jgi:hypothetical protein